MRTGTITNNSGETIADVRYPDLYAFAFNPLLVTVSESYADAVKSVYVQVGDNFDEKELIGGEAIFDVSVYAQSLFDLSKIERPEERILSMAATISVVDNDGKSHDLVGGFFVNVIWGAIAPKEEYNALSTLRWYSNLPMTIEFFANSGANIYKRIDMSSTEVFVESATSSGIVSINPAEVFWSDAINKKATLSIGDVTNVFDDTFDFTFKNYANEWSITLTKDETTCGVFLRWIAKHGFLRYFLFAKGDETTTSEEYGDRLYMRYSAFGRHYPDIYRQQGKTVERNMNIAALQLTKDEYEYVRSVAFSPVVDMYIGNNDNGKAEWLPVVISSGDITRGHKDTLQDMEITITLKEETQKF